MPGHQVSKAWKPQNTIFVCGQYTEKQWEITKHKRRFSVFLCYVPKKQMILIIIIDWRYWKKIMTTKNKTPDEKNIEIRIQWLKLLKLYMISAMSEQKNKLLSDT